MAQWGIVTFRANVNLPVLISGLTRSRDSAALTARETGPRGQTRTRISLTRYEFSSPAAPPAGGLYGGHISQDISEHIIRWLMAPTVPVPSENPVQPVTRDLARPSTAYPTLVLLG
jgi:hypothetical protein